MNSSKVPSCFWMTSATVPVTVDSKSSTSSGSRPSQQLSKPSTSQKRIVALHFTTPILASKPALNKRWTTAGGTYLDQERIAFRIVLKDSCSPRSSSEVSLTGALLVTSSGG